MLGAAWVIGLPAFFPDNDLVPLLTSSIGLLVLLLYFPGGLVQIGYAARAAIVRWMEDRLGPAPAKAQHAVPARQAEARDPLPEGVPALRAERDRRHASAASAPSTSASIEVARRRDRRPDRHQRRRQVDPHERHRRLLPVGGDRRAVRREGGPLGVGPGPPGPRPQLPGRHAVPRAHRAGDRPGRLRGPQAHRAALHRPVPAPGHPPGAAAPGRGRRAHRLPRPRPLRRHVHRRPVDRHPAHRRAGRACSPSTPACSASTSPPPASPSARPRPSARSSRRSAASCRPRCWSSSTTCR